MRWFVIFLCAVMPAVTRAQATQPAELDQFHAYLITIGPGGAIYEKFGHNMIWIHVPPPTRSGEPVELGGGAIDAAYNWGMFSFEQQNFIWKFIQGRMTYWMDAFDALKMIESYKRDDRSIWIHELNFTQDQILHLWQKLEMNRLPENKFYRYDYYRDNCSTRLRDAIDEETGWQIKWAHEATMTDHSFRWHTRRLTPSNFWLYTALNYVLGHPVDVKISQWQEMFLPVRMMDRLRTFQLRNGQPLIKREWLEYQSKSFAERNDPPQWVTLFFAIGMALSLVMALAWKREVKWRRVSWMIVATAWMTLGGIGGLISMWGWFFTDHVVSRYNENLLQLNPLMAALLVAAIAMIRSKGLGNDTARYLTMAVAGLTLAGVAVKLLPIFNQVNGEILALTVPANLGLAWGVWRMSRETAKPRLKTN